MKPYIFKKPLLVILLVAAFLVGCTGTRTVRTDHPLTVFATDHWEVYIRENGFDRPVTVLGHYPEYVELTEALQAESMQIPMAKWDRMSPARQWRTTTRYFNSRIRSGHHFRLATPPGKARPGSYYVRELDYLSGKGYRLSPDSLWLVR